MARRRLKFCGWGYEGEGLSREEEEFVLGSFAERFGISEFDRRDTRTADDACQCRAGIQGSGANRPFNYYAAHPRLCN